MNRRRFLAVLAGGGAAGVGVERLRDSDESVLPVGGDGGGDVMFRDAVVHPPARSGPFIYESARVFKRDGRVRGEFVVQNAGSESAEYVGDLDVWDRTQDLIRDRWSLGDPFPVEGGETVEVAADLYTPEREGVFAVYRREDQKLGEVEFSEEDLRT